MYIYCLKILSEYWNVTIGCSNRCRDIVIFKLLGCRPPASWISLDLCNGPNSPEGGTASPIHRARFRQNRSNCGRDMAIFRFFQDGGHPPSWICNECVGTTYERHLVVFITVQNLVGIDAVVFTICTFFDFASLAWKCTFTPQICFFGGFDHLNGVQCEKIPKKAHRLSHHAWKSVDMSDV